MQAVLMIVFLLVFAFGLAVVLSCYRDDDPKHVMQGIRRRTLVFTVAVIGFATVAYVTSATVLFPG